MPVRSSHHAAPPGFTLPELLIVIGILGILASLVLVFVNPAEQFGKAKDAQRVADLDAILNAVRQFEIANKGRLPRYSETINSILLESNPASKEICRYDSSDFTYTWCHANNYRYLGELVPDYLNEIPIDPDHEEADTWGTDYFIWKDADGRITVHSSLYDDGAGIDRKL